MTPELSEQAVNAVRTARQSGRRVVLDCTAEVNDELYAAGLITRSFRVSWGNRVVWPLTEQGLRLHDELTGRNTVVTTAAVDRVLGPLREDQD